MGLLRGACRPLAAEAKPHQSAENEELLKALGKSLKGGEQREPQVGDLQRAHAADTK